MLELRIVNLCDDVIAESTAAAPSSSFSFGSFGSSSGSTSTTTAPFTFGSGIKPLVVSNSNPAVAS